MSSPSEGCLPPSRWVPSVPSSLTRTDRLSSMDQEAILKHYGTGYERKRLEEGASRIEFVRTKELLRRFLPPPPASVLDVGGGPGAYAARLSHLGYRGHLIYARQLHVE